jgi:hypothetical protein
MINSQIQRMAGNKKVDAQYWMGCIALTVLLSLAAPARTSADVSFQVSSLAVQTRYEGLAETVGAVTLSAQANGTIASGSTLTIAYSAPIANTAGFPGNNTAGLTCVISGTAGLASSCGSGTAYFTTTASGSTLTVQFNSQVSFNTADYIVVSQVRLNVNSLGPATATATASISGSTGLTFTQSQVSVASIINPSIRMSVSTFANPIQTCAVVVSSFALRITENYPAALTSLADEQNFSNLGVVTNGTQINVTINNVPSGFGVAFSSAVPQSGASLALTLQSPGLVVSSGSPITFTLAATMDSTAASESIVLNFGIGLTNNNFPALISGSAPQIGTVVGVTASVSLGPNSGVVSFATNNEGTGTVTTIGDCVTNLLFPFTTSQVGFDTTFQISNTSSDRLAFGNGGATPLAGTCTLTYYPTDLTTQTSSANGVLGSPSQTTTPLIPSGGVYSFAQSTTSFRNQSGYMFAVCRFLDAHGFYFIANGTPGSATISQGLLALVIPNGSISTGRLANPSPTCAATPLCTGVNCGNVTVSAICTTSQGVTFAPGLYEGIAH